MKNIILLLALMFSVTTSIAAEEAFLKGRTAAIGDDPGLKIETGDNNGTFVTGADLSNAVPYCKNCENRNNIRLNSNTNPEVKKGSSSKGSGSSSSQKTGN